MKDLFHVVLNVRGDLFSRDLHQLPVGPLEVTVLYQSIYTQLHCSLDEKCQVCLFLSFRSVMSQKRCWIN